MKSMHMTACVGAMLFALALPSWAETDLIIEAGVLKGYSGDDPSGALVIPPGVEEIFAHAFEGCTGITSVSLPDSLKIIENCAFQGCESLTTVTGGANLRRIDEGAFSETRFVCGDKYFDGFDSDEEADAYNNGLELVYLGNFVVGRRGELARGWDDDVAYDEEDNYIWRYTLTLRDGTVGVAGGVFQEIPITTIVMPDSLKYIGDCAFAYNEALQQIKFGSGLKVIGQYAFEGSGGIFADDYWDLYPVDEDQPITASPDRDDANCVVSIALPDTVEEIGPRAFANCGFIYYVSGLKNRQWLEDDIFDGTPYAVLAEQSGGSFQCIVQDGVLTECVWRNYLKLDDPWIVSGALTIPEGVVEIEEEVFCGNGSITSASLPASLKRIGWRAFYECINLKTVTGGANLEMVGGEAFGETRFVCGDKYIDGTFESEAEMNAYFDGLEIIYLGNWAVGCRGRLEAAYHDDVNYDAQGNFIGNYPLRFKDGTVGIANELCKELRLTSIEMPDTVKYLGSEAFGWADWIKQLKLSQGLEWIGSCVFSSSGSEWAQAYWDNQEVIPSPDDPNAVTSITLPPTLKYIGEAAFNCFSYLYYVNGLRPDIELGPDVFTGTPYADRCEEEDGDYRFVVEDGILLEYEHVENVKFDEGNWVKDGVLTIPEGITMIDVAAVSGLETFTKVILPSTLTEIRDGAFGDCYNLKYVEGLRPDIVVGENVFDGTPYLDGWETPTLVIENGVVKGFDWVLGHEEGCIVDGVLTIPEGVVEIDGGAFGYEECFTSVSLPKSLKKIGGWAFCNCPNLKTVTGGENLEEVGTQPFDFTPFVKGDKYFAGFDTDQEEFDYNHNIEPVYVGNFIVGVRGNLADDVYDQQYYDANGKWLWSYDLVIRDGTTGMAEGCFEGMPITSVKIPGSVSVIPIDAFGACSLTSLTLGEGIEEIGENAFFSNVELKSVDLPESMLFVGWGAFCQCDLLQNVTFRSEDTVFDSSSFSLFRSYGDNDRAVEAWDYENNTSTINWVQSKRNYNTIAKITLVKEGYHVANWIASIHDISTLPPDMAELPGALNGQIADPAKCGEYPGDGVDAFNLTYGQDYQEPGYYDPSTMFWMTWDCTYKLTPVVERNFYSIDFDPNGGTVTALMPTLSPAYGDLVNLPVCRFTRAGYEFLGWALTPDGDVEFLDEEPVENLIPEGTITLYAVWERGSLWEPVSGNAGRRNPRLEAAAATAYNAYAFDANGKTVGTVEIKAGKAKGKKGQDLKTATVSMSIQLLGAKKETVKGNMIVTGGAEEEIGLFRGKTKSGQQVLLRFGANGVSGKIGDYTLDGAVNKFTAKDAESKNLAAKVLAKYQGAYTVAFKTAAGWNGLSLVVGSKGKTKVSGTLADGSKVSATVQLMIGDEDVCSLAMVYSKKNVNLAFNLWISDEGVGISGLEDAIAGKVGLTAGAAFHLDAAALAQLIGDNTYAAYFPEGLAVALDGKKLVVANGAKAGKVALNKEKTAVDEAKAGANPSALKLGYTAKTGAFKGTFKAYVNANGKPKAVTVTVTGVLLDGAGYGTALIKKAGSIPVEIK